jgi:hypothetical protein
MPHLLAARPTAVAHRGRVLAPLVGVLALVLALFAMTAPAGAKATHTSKPPVGKPAPPAYAPQDKPADKPAAKPPAQKPDDEAGKPKDDQNAGKPKDEDKNAGKPKDEDKNAGKPKDEDHNQGKPKDEDHNQGQPVNEQCPGANEGPGNAQGTKDNATYQKAKQDKNTKAKDDENAANCPPPAQPCKQGEVKKNGMCVPVGECKPPYVVDHGECKPPVNNACKPGEVKQGNMCIPVEECKPPNVVDNGECKPPANNACMLPNVVVNGVCGPPATTTTPTPTPTPTPVGGQPAAPQAAAAPASTTPPTSVVAGTQARAATARLSAQSRCGTRSFRVTISGRNLRRVTLFVAGRRVRTVTVPAGRRSITVSVPVRQFGARRQSVRARVTFRNGAASRTLTASATRCAQTAVSPQFTG